MLESVADYFGVASVSAIGNAAVLQLKQKVGLLHIMLGGAL